MPVSLRSKGTLFSEGRLPVRALKALKALTGPDLPWDLPHLPKAQDPMLTPEGPSAPAPGAPHQGLFSCSCLAMRLLETTLCTDFLA